jgi:hypothetical protein
MLSVSLCPKVITLSGFNCSKNYIVKVTVKYCKGVQFKKGGGLWDGRRGCKANFKDYFCSQFDRPCFGLTHFDLSEWSLFWFSSKPWNNLNVNGLCFGFLQKPWNNINSIWQRKRYKSKMKNVPWHFFMFFRCGSVAPKRSLVCMLSGLCFCP